MTVDIHQAYVERQAFLDANPGKQIEAGQSDAIGLKSASKRTSSSHFLSCGLQVTLKARLKRYANGLTPRAVLEKFAAVQMLDVRLPTTDGREIVLTRYTQPEKRSPTPAAPASAQATRTSSAQDSSPASATELRKLVVPILTTM